jgi:hypothetical protein
MKVDLKPFLPSDKNFKAEGDLMMGTTIQNFGLGKYSVQMIFLGMAIPSKMVGTNEDAVALEEEIWKAVKND